MKICQVCPKVAKFREDLPNGAYYCSQGCQIDYCLKPDIGVKTIVKGKVQASEKYSAIRLDSLDKDELVRMAKKYVEIHKLGWIIRAPYAWSEYNIGPHITIENTKHNNENVEIVLKCMNHFTTNTSRWIVIEVEVPSKFKCQFGCHLSIGQERI